MNKRFVAVGTVTGSKIRGCCSKPRLDFLITSRWQQMMNAIRWIKQFAEKKSLQSLSYRCERDGSSAYCNGTQSGIDYSSCDVVAIQLYWADFAAWHIIRLIQSRVPVCIVYWRVHHQEMSQKVALCPRTRRKNADLGFRRSPRRRISDVTTGT